MDCQNLNSLRHNETRRRQALFLRIAALCLGSAATGCYFFPFFMVFLIIYPTHSMAISC